jgi:peptide/nickel transport system substrate-binding protein
MSKFKFFSFLMLAALLVAACAQAAPPAATQETVATEAPVVTEAPVATEAPATTEEPVATEAPAVTEAPVEVEVKPVVIASPNDMDTLDPHAVTGMFPYRSLTYWMFDVLVTADRDGLPEPELAKEWTRIDSLTWEFKLVENATFQNGEPFNAEAVKYSFERMQQEDYKNFNQIFRRTSLVEIKVIDDYTVQMITEKPAPEFLYWLSESFIVPPKYYSEHDAEFLTQNPVGSGPYKIVEWVKDDHITFVANEDYFQGAPQIKDVVFRVIPEASSRLNELITGNVDLVTGLNPDQAAMADSDVSQMIAAQSWRKMHIGIAQDGNEILRNKLVRQALNYAVDKQAIIDAILLGTTSPLQAMVNPPLNNPDLEPYPYDPEKAKALLAEAGYPDGFTVVFQSPIERYGMDKDISQIVAQYFNDVGVKTEFEAVEWGKYLEFLDAKSFEGLYFMGYSTYIVPGPQLGTMICGALDNPGDYCNAEYDALFEQFNTTEDEAKRQEISNQMQALIWEDAAWVYLWRLPLFMGTSTRLVWEAHPALYVDVWEMTLK